MKVLLSRINYIWRKYLAYDAALIYTATLLFEKVKSKRCNSACKNVSAKRF